jgi:hypothetical protein
MEFRRNQKQIEIKRRESFLAIVFVSLVLIIGTIGIIGPKPSITRVGAATAFLVFFGVFIKYIHNDSAKTKQKMLSHRLLIQNNLLILQQGESKEEFDLQAIDSLRFEYKKGSVNSIVINVRKNFEFKIKGYERMDVMSRLLKESVPSSKLKPQWRQFLSRGCWRTRFTRRASRIAH